MLSNTCKGSFVIVQYSYQHGVREKLHMCQINYRAGSCYVKKFIHIINNQSFL